MSKPKILSVEHYTAKVEIKLWEKATALAIVVPHSNFTDIHYFIKNIDENKLSFATS